MRASPRHLLSYTSFVALLVLDAVALVSLLLVQLLGAPMPIAWLAAGILTAMAAPALQRFTNEVFGKAHKDMTIPQAGESFL